MQTFITQQALNTILCAFYVNGNGLTFNDFFNNWVTTNSIVDNVTLSAQQNYFVTNVLEIFNKISQ